MKMLIGSFLVLVLIISFGTDVNAQQTQGNAVLVQKLEAAFPQDGSMAEFDSLTHAYNTKVWDKNPFVISHKTVRHWWGNDSRDVIEITEIKTWEDIPKAMAKNRELFNEAWNTQKARKEFNDAYNKYFSGKHSDEIYQEVKFSK